MPSKEDSPALSPKEAESSKHSDTQVEPIKLDQAELSNGEQASDLNVDEDSSQYPMDLPLEVITTVGSQPYSYPYPVLKNMSNGVLTHRNIFTDSERETLMNIVDKYREIIDTRSRTREIFMEKQTTWQQIVEEYNSTDNVMVRTEKELRKCWDNMKYRARLARKALEQSTEHSDSHHISNAVQAVLDKMLCLPSPDSCPSESNFKEEHHEDNGLISDDRSSHYLSEEDEAPAFKKARQESPKLSSLLLGDKKVSPTHYTIPNCTQVTHVKKMKKNASHVNILPKSVRGVNGLTALPNGSISLGGGVTISPQRSDKRTATNFKRTAKKCSFVDVEKEILEQRLHTEAKEHELRLRVLEKQLQASANESAFWAMRVKLLKSQTIVNGDA